MPKGGVGCLVLWCCLVLQATAQEDQSKEKSIPPIGLLRAEASYQFVDTLKDRKVFLQPLKWIPVSRSKKVFLTLGGGYRARLEHFTNENYTTEDVSYYSQRVDFNASLSLGEKMRLFGEVYSGYVTAPEKLLLESEDIDLHQGFVEWKPFKATSTLNATIRLGRQEIGYGASRLVGIREGPNMRRSFDMGRIILRRKKASLDVLYGKEVSVLPDAFDNASNLFDGDASNPTFWGLYYSRPFLKDIGKLDLYYFGFHSNFSRFNDVAGEESRHSLGARSYSIKGRLSYNTEIIVQVGTLGASDIIAYNIETDWKYLLLQNNLKPRLGIKFDWSSGDQEAGDGEVGTFNPLFVNPAIYSLAAVNTPANVTSLHPNFSFQAAKRLRIFVDYALFYRTQKEDGLYGPPRFLSRESNGIGTRHIGDVFGLQIQYEVNRNVAFDLRSSYFIAGRFLEETGASENTFYIAPTLGLKF